MRTFLCLSFCCILLVPSLRSNILRVPQNYSTIQAAMNVAQNADTVLVAEGTYYENIRYSGKGIVVTSRYFITHDWQTVAHTIIDGSSAPNKDSAASVQFLNQEDSTAVLDGFTITGGTGMRWTFGSTVGVEGGGIMIWQSPQNSGIVENNVIVCNYSAATGGGIEISVTDGTTIPIVKNNIVWGNRQTTSGQIDFPQYITGYNDVEDYSGGTNISVFPQLQANTFLLSSTSPCIDAGDASIGYNDIENPGHPGFALSPSQGTVRNDIGAFGGFFAKVLPSIDTTDFRLSGNSISLQCSTKCQKTVGIELLNLSSKSLTIDSVTVLDTATFSLNKNFSRRTVNFLTYDSIKITFRPSTRDNFNDTVRVYHHIAGKTNPLKIPISATSNSAPFLNNSIPGQTAYVDQLFTFQIPDSTFLDPDIGDSLMYQANGLPSWLSFNAQTHTFQGTPTQTVRLITIGITVNDLLLTSASTTLHLAVVTPTTDVDNSPLSPAKYELLQNYPNPFNPTTTIEFSLRTQGFVTLKIFDILGREIITLLREERSAGNHIVQWNGSRLPSGVYFCAITCNNLTQIKTMMLLK